MIDLHTHSTISDGALTPTQLVQAAAQNGCRLLALTDHDHTGGLAEARAEAARHGIRFINGAEISVTWRHRTIHIVALDFDEHNSRLQTLLAQVRQGRIERLHQIAAKLAKHGITGAAKGALALAANPEMVSRTHIADWLVQQGHARNKQQAFTRYLGDGKSASVRHQWAELPAAIAAIQAEVDIHVAASVGILTQEQVDRLAAAGIHRYNHNLETAKSFFPSVVTTHTWESRRETLRMIKEAGIEVCSGGILGMGESLEQRAEFAADLQELQPEEVPMNFLDPRPGTPFADYEVMEASDALRAIGAFRLALPKTILRFAGGRELTLGDLGAEQGLQGGINAIIVGNYLTTLGRPQEQDLDMMGKLRLPIKALNATV